MRYCLVLLVGVWASLFPASSRAAQPEAQGPSIEALVGSTLRVSTLPGHKVVAGRLAAFDGCHLSLEGERSIATVELTGLTRLEKRKSYQYHGGAIGALAGLALSAAVFASLADNSSSTPRWDLAYAFPLTPVFAATGWLAGNLVGALVPRWVKVEAPGCPPN